jgi:predicted nucleic acid-binding protein
VKRVVLDASALVSLAAPDERSSEVSALVGRALKGELELISSEHAKLEVAEALNRALRRGRFTDEDHHEAVELLSSIPLVYRPLAAPVATYAGFAVSFGLSAYDAAYLALAIEESATLVSVDSMLADAAERAGVRWTP